ncbi:DinB family protein [Paenibacillus sp. BC26]|uniref:DinB family protein n=1 Tax=Paenibacillus sp. BC26 TaxID=1881032 RepID=UPI00210B0291|nr:DinB family protein [Paenibacillus sp. BC26]
MNVPYDQENWVKAQRYIDAPPEEVLALRVSLNQSVLRVITGLSPASLARTGQFPSGTTVTSEWLIDDYVAHMEHHLQQIFGHA